MAIKTVADLIHGIVAKNRPILDAEAVKHGPTIGDMYEGLTAHILERGLPFKGVELDVVTGFAEGADGTLSPQLDCMIVVGKGRSVPFTGHHVYPLDQVVAAVEVKKTLYADDISNAYEKFQKVSQMRPTVAPLRRAVADRTFRSITNRLVPDEPDKMPEPWRTIYGAVTLESVMPARIVWGYHGYKSLTAFRKAIADDLLARVGTRGTGPLSLPTLIVGDRFVAVKGDGIPYRYCIDDDLCWPVLTSSTEPPTEVLLEILWSRLTARFGEIPGMFGEDLELTSAHRLLDFKLHESKAAWEVLSYADIDMESRTNSGPKTLPWSPTWLTVDEFVVVNWLCKHDVLDLEHPIPGARQETLKAAVDV